MYKNSMVSLTPVVKSHHWGIHLILNHSTVQTVFLVIQICTLLPSHYSHFKLQKNSTILRHSRKRGLKSEFKLTKLFLTVQKQMQGECQIPFKDWSLISSVLPLLQQIYECKNYAYEYILLQYCNLQTLKCKHRYI